FPVSARQGREAQGRPSCDVQPSRGDRRPVVPASRQSRHVLQSAFGTADLQAVSQGPRSRPMTAETIHTCSYECERPECIRAQRDELAARLTAAQQQQPAEGEDIMVNTPYDVFILPLRPSRLDGKGPRFVVHVPGPEQPAPQAQSSTEAWRDLAIAGAAIVEEIREIVGLKGKFGDVVEAVRELAAALEAARDRKSVV